MGKRYYGKKKPAEAGGSTTATSHKARTPGLEDVVFTFGKAKDAAVFENTKDQLVRYVATQSWKHASDASRALETLTAPRYTEPPEPAMPFCL